MYMYSDLYSYSTTVTWIASMGPHPPLNAPRSPVVARKRRRPSTMCTSRVNWREVTSWRGTRRYGSQISQKGLYGSVCGLYCSGRGLDESGDGRLTLMPLIHQKITPSIITLRTPLTGYQNLHSKTWAYSSFFFCQLKCHITCTCVIEHVFVSRFQTRNIPVQKPEDPGELEDEARWVYDQAFLNQPISKQVTSRFIHCVVRTTVIVLIKEPVKNIIIFLETMYEKNWFYIRAS